MDGASAAVVSYRRQGESVSLAITPRTHAGRPSETPRTEMFRDVPFESREMQGHHVITWNEGAMSHSLVSSTSARGCASCQVCHGQSSGIQRVEEIHGLR